MNHLHTSIGMRIVAATALAVVLPLSAAPAQAVRPTPTAFTVNCVASTNLLDNQAWVTSEPEATNWVTYVFTPKHGESIIGDPSGFKPSGFAVRPPAVMATAGGSVTATAWTDDTQTTQLATATGKCTVNKKQFAVTCVANTVEDGPGRAAETNPPDGTGVVFYDFFNNGVPVGEPMYSFMIYQGAAVITPVGATSVTARAWTTTAIGEPPQLGDVVGEATTDCL